MIYICPPLLFYETNTIPSVICLFLTAPVPATVAPGMWFSSVTTIMCFYMLNLSFISLCYWLCEVYIYIYIYIFSNVGQDITNLLLFLLSSLPSWNSGSQEETGGWNSSPPCSATSSQACSPTSQTDLSSIETRDAKPPLIRRRQRQRHSNQTQSRQWSEE